MLSQEEEEENHDDIYGWNRFILKNICLRCMNRKAVKTKSRFRYVQLSEKELRQFEKLVKQFLTPENASSVDLITKDIHDEVLEIL